MKGMEVMNAMKAMKGVENSKIVKINGKTNVKKHLISSCFWMVIIVITLKK